MDFRIADTFTTSLSKLAGDEQKAAKTTAFDLQMNPVSPGMKLHRIEHSKDKDFWSVRVNDGIRIIVHRSKGSLLLCYVGQHEDAYRWAERRKIERHPTTGAAQLVEVRETVRELEIPVYVEPQAGGAVAATNAEPKPPLFAAVDDADLLGFGVPEEWLQDVRGATEDTLFDLTDHLPPEAAEALLELATGGRPRQPVVAEPEADPFAHPDAQRRFRVVTNVEELQQALEYPWEKWMVFLHPAQRETVERCFSGPARVAGSAGTGKTIVAMHRAVHLARLHPEARVLLTTFSVPLARALGRKLRMLVGGQAEVMDRFAVRAIDEVGLELYEGAFGKPQVPTAKMLRTLLRAASESGEAHKFSMHFIETEWTEVVDAWQLDSWEAYRDVRRLGRKTRLGEKQRAVLWEIFGRVRAELSERGLATLPMVFAKAAEHVRSLPTPPFDYVVVDEAQDLGVPQLRLLAALGGDRADALFFAGDLGQRIFQTPFSWKALGVDVCGRSQTLRINYRTSHQIRRQADRLLPPEMADVDQNVESRRGTVSVFNGAEPQVSIVASEEEETRVIAAWLAARGAEGVQPHEVGIFVRSPAELPRARRAAAAAGLAYADLDSGVEQREGQIALSTMHLAKGLEFRAVVVAACDDEVVPLQSRIEAVGDEADLEDVYDTERHLLYVACTRARDHLLITGVEPGSEFLGDMV